MVYNTDGHIPTQVEYFLSSFNTKDIDVLNTSFEIIKDLVKDNGFKKHLSEYEQEKMGKEKKIEMETLNKLHSCKTISDAIQIISSYKDNFDEIQINYLTVIRKYVIGYFNTVDVNDVDEDVHNKVDNL